MPAEFPHDRRTIAHRRNRLLRRHFGNFLMPLIVESGASRYHQAPVFFPLFTGAIAVLAALGEA